MWTSPIVCIVKFAAVNGRTLYASVSPYALILSQECSVLGGGDILGCQMQEIKLEVVWSWHDCSYNTKSDYGIG